MTRALFVPLGVALGVCVSWGASASARAAPAVSLDASFDRDTVGLDQTVQLTINVTSHSGHSPDKVELPNSPALQVVGTSKSEQSSFSMGNGGIDSSHTTTYLVSLRPLKIGDYNLAPPQAVIDGKTIKGNPLHLKIVAAGKGPPPQQRRSHDPFGNMFGSGSPFGNLPNFPPMPGFSQQQGNPNDQSQPDSEDDDPFAQLFGGRPPGNEDVILLGSVDKKQVVLGQQVTYTVRLYTRAEISEFSDLKLPGFDGFWGEDLETPTRPVPKLQTLGGVPYQVYLIKKKALFPDRAGALSIDPAEIDVAVGLGFFRGRRVHRTSAPLTIEVKPLPEGAPAGFPVTNVGEWRFSAALSPAQVPAGEPVTLTLSVEGQGNLHGLTLPTLPKIEGLRIYDPTATDKLSPQGDRFGGRRQVDIILIPQRTGDFELPPLTFQWYDPQRGGGSPAAGYQSTTTPKLTLRATAGASQNGSATPVAGGQNVLESTFRPLRDRPTLLAACSGRALGAVLPGPLEGLPLALGLGLPPACLAGVFLLGLAQRRRQAGAPAQRGRRAFRTAGEKLAAAAVAGSAEGSAQALFGYLEDRVEEPMAGLAYPELRARLLAHGVDETTVRATLQALELAESLRYQPRGHDQTRELEKLRAMSEFALDALERSGLKARAAGRAA